MLNENSKKTLDLNKIFMSGGAALATSFSLMHPLDTLRVHLQKSKESRIKFGGYKNFLRFSSSLLYNSS